MIPELIFVIVLSSISLVSYKLSDKIKKHPKLTNFGVGIMITFIFLEFFPLITNGYGIIGNGIFFLLLWGFILFYVIEKYIYHYTKEYWKLYHKLAWTNMVAFSLEQFLLGIAIVFIVQISQTYLILIPLFPLFLFYNLSTTLDLIGVYNKILVHAKLKLVPFFCMPAGALIAVFIKFPIAGYYLSLSFILGLLLFIVLRDMFSKSIEKGDPVFIILGNIFALIVILLRFIFIK